MTVDPRDQRIADLEALVTRLLEKLDAQEQRLAKQDARIAELEAQVRQTSHNSSCPSGERA